MKTRIAKRLQNISPSKTLQITAKTKELKKQGENVISFAVGEPDFPTPEYIAKAGKKAIDSGRTKYTASSGTPELKSAIKEKFKKDNGIEYDLSEIVVSNGAKQSVFNALAAVVNDGDEVLIPSPYWLTYPEAVKAVGGKPKFILTKKENGYKMSVKDLKKAITRKTKLLIFNSPCNPTGAVYSEEEIRAFAPILLKKKIFVLADEIYEKLIYDGEKHFSFANVSSEMKDWTITVNGVSKTYAMTGWRIGYLGAPKDIAAAIDSFQSHSTSGASSISQYAAEIALTNGKGEVEEMKHAFERRRNLILQELLENEIESTTPKGAFYVLADVSKYYKKRLGKTKIKNSVGFANLLLDEEKVAVVPGVAFGDDKVVRLSYALSDDDITEGVRRIGEFLRKLK